MNPVTNCWTYRDAFLCAAPSWEMKRTITIRKIYSWRKVLYSAEYHFLVDFFDRFDISSFITVDLFIGRHSPSTRRLETSLCSKRLFFNAYMPYSSLLLSLTFWSASKTGLLIEDFYFHQTFYLVSRGIGRSSISEDTCDLLILEICDELWVTGFTTVRFKIFVDLTVFNLIIAFRFQLTLNARSISFRHFLAYFGHIDIVLQTFLYHTM